LNDNAFKVIFNGNAYTSRENINKNLLRRCAELTLNYGYQYFVMRNSVENVDSYNSNNVQEGIYNPFLMFFCE